MPTDPELRPSSPGLRQRSRWGRRSAGLLTSAAMTVTAAAGVLGVGMGAAPAGASVDAGTAACAPSQTATPAELDATTGVTPTSVTVGNVSIISGPVPGLFEGAPTGVKAYFAYINSKGGVYHRKLLLNSQDDGFSGSANAAETASIIGADFAMVGNFSLFDDYGCKLLAQNPAVSDVSVTLDPGTSSLPNDFSVQPLKVGLGLGPLYWLRHKYPDARTVGTIVSDEATAVAQWDGEKAGLEHAGYKVQYVDEVNPLQSDFTTDIINMRNQGVNVLYMTALDWQVAALIMRDAYQQNWHPALIFSGGPVYADQFIKAAGGPSIADGIYITQVQALYLGQDEKSVPAVKTFLTWVHKVNPSWTPDLYTLYGWASAQLFTQALQAAGPDPTRGKVLDALKKITTFDADGLLAPANPAGKVPSSCYVIAKIENGQYKRVYPAKTGFACNSSYFYAPSSS